jgi:hypothetical protein
MKTKFLAVLIFVFSLLAVGGTISPTANAAVPGLMINELNIEYDSNFTIPDFSNDVSGDLWTITVGINVIDPAISETENLIGFIFSTTGDEQGCLSNSYFSGGTPLVFSSPESVGFNFDTVMPFGYYTYQFNVDTNCLRSDTLNISTVISSGPPSIDYNIPGFPFGPFATPIPSDTLTPLLSYTITYNNGPEAAISLIAPPVIITGIFLAAIALAIGFIPWILRRFKGGNRP